MGTPSDSMIKSPLSDLHEESETDLVANNLATARLSNRSYPKQVTMGRRTSDSTMNADLYLEATGRRRSSDHGVVLTTDTDSFIIGQRVWVGGTKPGHIAYIGETHFAPGDWAGVVLDEPNGKNDGCVSGKRYFQCEPKKGIFSRLTRLTHDPLPGAVISSKESSPGYHRSSKTPDRSRTVSPTSSLRSSAIKSPAKHGLTVGDRVIVSSGFGSKTGTLRYIGETRFAQGNWCGIQLDEPIGKNDGSVDGFRYFECLPKYGLFVPIAKVSLSPSSKKSRLSRAGSRESLASNLTMNSIATTNTSRLRMNAHGQTLAYSTTKPTVTPRSTYSLQDVIREKQNHIEQLIKERELDKEDAQNQTVLFQKTINELQSRVHDLEKKLIEEKKQSEELQSNFEEVTFCSDELNAQLQEYRDKLTELEMKLQQSNKTEKINLDSSIDSSIQSKENNSLISKIYKFLSNTELNSIEFEKELQSVLPKNSALLRLLEEKEYSITNLKKQLSDSTDNKHMPNILHLQEEVLDLTKEIASRDSKIVEDSQLISNLRTELEALTRKLNEFELSHQQLIERNTEKESQVECVQQNLKSINEDMKSQMKIVEGKIMEMSSQIVEIEKEKQHFQTLNDEKQSKIDSLQNQIESFQAFAASNEIKQKELDALQKEMETVRNEKGQLLEINSEKQKQIGQLSGQLESTRFEYDKLKKLFEEKSVEYKNNETNFENVLQQKTNEIYETKKTLENLSANLNAQGNQLTVENQQLVKSNEEKSNEIEKLKGEIESFKMQLEQTKQQLLELNQEKQNEVENLRKQFEVDRTKLNNEQNELSTRNEQEKIKLLSEIAEKESKAKSLENEIEILQKKIKEMQEEFINTKSVMTEENNQKQIELDLLRNQVEQLNALLAENQQKTEQIKSLESIIENQNQDLIKLMSKKHEETETLQKNIDVLQTELNNKNLLLTEKSSEIELKYQQVIEENSSKQTEIVSLQQTLAIVKAELAEKNEQLIQERDGHQSKINSLQDTVATIQAKFDEQKNLFEAKLNELMKSNEENAEKTKQIEALNASLESMRNEIDQDKKEIDALRKSLNSQKTELEAKNSLLLNENESLKERLKLLEQELDSKNQLLKDQEARILNGEENIRSFKELEQTHLSQEAKHDQLRVEKDMLEKELALLNEKFSNAVNEFNNKIENLEKTNNELKISLAEKETNLTGLKSEQSDIHENFTSLQSSYQKLLTEYEELKKENEDLSTKNIIFKQEEESLKIKQTELESQQVFTTEEIERLKKTYEAEKSKLITDFEDKLKQSESVKQTLDESIRNLNKQIELLQNETKDELEKWSSKESNVLKQLEIYHNEKQEIINKFKKLNDDNEEMQLIIKNLQDELNAKTDEIRNLKMKELEITKINNNLENMMKDASNSKLQKEHEKCNKIINELQNNFKTQNSILSGLQEKVREFERENNVLSQNNNVTKTKYENLLAEYQKISVEKKTVAGILQGAGDSEKSETDDYAAQISFLNSIIADMQKKNENLMTKIQMLESMQTNFSDPNAFGMLTKRKPAPRLFCDICEVFDAHDTEDCPLQCSNSPPKSKLSDEANGKDERKLPPPRSYCDVCEVFGHDTNECPDDRTF